MKRIKPVAPWLCVLVAVACALLYAESDLLWKVGQHSLFLYSSLFFKQQMVVPGGMLSYLGTFFTQFFFHPWQGVVMLCGWWLLLLWLTKRAFDIPDRWNVVALVPVAVLITTNMCMGYWVYVMKLQGWFFVPTIGTTAAVALLWAFRKLPEKLWLRIVFVVLTVLAAYPLMGVYGLAAALLMAVWTWRLSKRHTQNALLSAAALLAVLAVPLLYYRFVYYQTSLADIYRTALPVFAIFEEHPLYYIPYYLLAGSFLGLCFLPGFNPNPSRGRERVGLLLRLALLAVLVAGVWHFWYKDANFHHELRMARCIEQADWEGVIEEGKTQTDEPTRAIVMMHNLALSRLGRQCDEMYSFPKGSKRSNTPLPIYMFTVAGRMINYQYGLLNESHRMCMEQGVEYGWSAELLQYMARNALLGNEPQAARKYLNLLRQTLFYGEWADHMEELLDHPELLARNRETGPVTHMLHYDDIQSQGDGYVEKNLMNILSRLDSDDPYFQEQAVLAAMWTRNPDDFWPRIIRYAQLRPNQKMPRIFMEAACLFGHMQEQDFIVNLPDKSVLNSFNSFMQQLQQNKGRSAKELRRILFPFYGNTYYFEYFFLKDITYY